MQKNEYRSHSCNEININHISKVVSLSGWIHSIRNHGSILFIDLRDFYGTTQIVIENNIFDYEKISSLSSESVISIKGIVNARKSEDINKDIDTGQIEIFATEVKILSKAKPLPFQINKKFDKIDENLRLEYRYLDIRKKEVLKNLKLRSNVIKYIRDIMSERGFFEVTTPILTSSSPEGARDFLVPSRIHKGKFYALPQAPQQFKQLLMVGGIDKYFQIAPCFRDEDSRADRSPGEFYQLDIEMSFVTQEDIFIEIESLIRNIFLKFGNKFISSDSFQRIKYSDAILHYGSDKPDLRNPIINFDATVIFKDSDFSIFATQISKGAFVRAIPAKNCAKESRSFFDQITEEAIQFGAKGLAYIFFDENGEAKGPIAKFLTEDKLNILKALGNFENGDAVFFTCDKEQIANKIAGFVRTYLGKKLNLINNNEFKFCWIIDFPFFEWNTELKKIDFVHNPFSMPQCDLQFLNSAKKEDLLSLKAFQYDIVCNGYELSSGGIRNHNVEMLYKVFEIAGYEKEIVKEKFPSLIKAFEYGVPPHGGIAPGIERILMLLSDSENIREVVPFPLNGKGQDLMMNAPSNVTEMQLKELGIKIDIKS